MPTPAERKALLFLAGVIVLGASVRVVRAARDDGGADVATRQALSRQIAAVDSARRDEVASDRVKASRRRAGTRRRGGKPARVRTADSSNTAHRDSVTRMRRIPDSLLTPPAPVDLDVAGESEIETLPRIGPVLARRIVEDRATNGPFGSMEGFERVRGVGPSLAASLRSRVTFSGTARPSNALAEQRLRSIPMSSKSPRRARRN